MFEIGSSLREARTRQGLELAELELRTKIRSKYLRLLEAEQFDQLPAPTYVKGFLRTYAEALGLDGQLYVDEYNSRFAVGDEEVAGARRPRSAPPRSRSRRRERSESRIVLLALVAIAVVTALVIAAWRFGGPGGTSVQGLTTPSAGTVRAAAKATLVVRGVRGASYVDVRSSSRGGRPLFQGTLLRGDVQRFTQRSLWIHVTTPRNVRLTFQGRRIALPRSGELTLGVGVAR